MWVVRSQSNYDKKAFIWQKDNQYGVPNPLKKSYGNIFLIEKWSSKVSFAHLFLLLHGDDWVLNFTQPDLLSLSGNSGLRL